MVIHRFQQLLRSDTQTVATSNDYMAFVACPLALFPMACHVPIQEIYRLAAERTRQQLTPPRRTIPAFSRN